jgi:hypothetical protein
MASILCTSVLADSFGTISVASNQQRSREVFLLEAATKPLESLPKKHKNYSAAQVLEMRLELLQFLGCVASTEMGIAALAKHESAVLRIALRVAEELDACYEWRAGEHSRLVFIFFIFTIYGRGADEDAGLNSLTSR